MLMVVVPANYFILIHVFFFYYRIIEDGARAVILIFPGNTLNLFLSVFSSILWSDKKSCYFVMACGTINQFG
jgi:hypothetical protein